MALQSVLESSTDADPIRRVIMQRIDKMSKLSSSASDLMYLEALLSENSYFGPEADIEVLGGSVIKANPTMKDKTDKGIPYWMKGETRSALDEVDCDMARFESTFAPPR